MANAQWISEHDVVSLIELSDAVDALRRGFLDEGMGRASALEKTMLGYGDHATLHALGAASVEAGLAGTKVWTHTPGGADPLLLLFDVGTGALSAVVEAFALGQLRTAGTAALATDILARPDATVAAVIGTGRQALPQVAAVALVRNIEEVRVFSRDATRRLAFAKRVHDDLGLECRPAASATEAVDGADVVTLVTRATEPVLTDAMVVEGVHVNAVGAIDLERREFEPSILGRCSTVVTDSLSQTRSFSSEFREFCGSGTGPGRWDLVQTMGQLVARADGPREQHGITLFKGMGSGIEDLALGVAVLERVSAPGSTVRGTTFGRTGRATPRLARRAVASVEGEVHR